MNKWMIPGGLLGFAVGILFCLSVHRVSASPTPSLSPTLEEPKTPLVFTCVTIRPIIDGYRCETKGFMPVIMRRALSL